MLGLGPGMLKECLDLELKKSGHILNIRKLRSDVRRKKQYEVPPDIPEFTVPIRHDFHGFYGAQVARNDV